MPVRTSRIAGVSPTRNNPLPFQPRLFSEFGGRVYPQQPHWSRRAELHWASVLIARVHRADALAATGEWNCICHACDVVRRQLAEVAS